MITYTHTNLIAEDWRRLTKFYIDVFGCRPVPPERDLSGSWLDDLTGIDDVHISGMHLLLPGYGMSGPTLEVFSYKPEELTDQPDAINRNGFSHIAFHTDDVRYTVDRLIEYGGSMIGQIVTRRYASGRELNVAYCRDPEGNSIEIQNWS